MKTTFKVCFLLLSSSVAATEKNTMVNTTSELSYWCKNKSSQHFFAKGITPYNWTSSSWTKLNTLNIKGSWKIKNTNQDVNCRILKGSLLKYAIIEMPSQAMTALTYDEIPTSSATDLRDWCKHISAQHFLKNNKMPYNWSARHWNKDNKLYVKGNWKINGSTKIINCQNTKGASEKYATFEITE